VKGIDSPHFLKVLKASHLVLPWDEKSPPAGGAFSKIITVSPYSPNGVCPEISD
jgi:hypothetical protein